MNMGFAAGIFSMAVLFIGALVGYRVRASREQRQQYPPYDYLLRVERMGAQYEIAVLDETEIDPNTARAVLDEQLAAREAARLEPFEDHMKGWQL